MASEVQRRFGGRGLVDGEAEGVALVLDHGLSFAMGFDVEAGRITDVHSAFTGASLVGRVLVMPSGRFKAFLIHGLMSAVRLLPPGRALFEDLKGCKYPVAVAAHSERRQMKLFHASELARGNGRTVR